MTQPIATWTCIANSCGQHSEQVTTWPEAQDAMRRHALHVPHHAQWPLTFRLDYGFGGEPGVHYEPAGATL